MNNNQARSITKFRQDFISKRNGRGSQLSHQPEDRSDPYQQRDVFGRHPKKLSKLAGNASNSESQLRDQRSHISANLRRELSTQMNESHLRLKQGSSSQYHQQSSLQ